MAEPSKPAPALRVVRVYLDGAHGLGKTTTGRALAAAASAAGGPVLFFPEPMAYWRTMFPTDALSGILAASARRAAAQGGRADADAAGLVAYYQARFAAPYLVLHARVAALLAPPEPAPGGDDVVTLVFDRHPLAACLCYPFARYCLREINAEDLLALAATAPLEAPGANLVVCTLPPAEQQRRLAARARPGDRADAGFLAAVRNAYALLANTCAFLGAGGAWRDGWDALGWADADALAALADPRGGGREPVPAPALRDTLFAALKCRELYPGGGADLPAVHAWALDALADRLAALEVFMLDVSAAPDACAAAVLGMRPAMRAARADGAAGATLADLARRFAREMTPGGPEAAPRGL
ncbi:thymidine kinase [Bovine alphaherpesvirus 5]|uniref:UL23 thymidine kinase n=2 Tax=Bovine alphaherpesvirus 5 TaxID=35244 RepID=Q6X234_9ALPH|nr:UL23 thymidine kinase [Bovine alphaherpesvirus 5]AAR86139.1 UL23 thymidine kinase [Bovine alphaherpesvirus 5]AQM74701.1 thymidine kinase [Bovine alphaherpesvirus 5]ART33261.1 thymidine kinase [Bovine alphaherpesvirus 5]QVY10569.1 UL23 thymidine kinase [Bovine alphaherpesvirus 5]UHJ15461.1 UL23 thymidine kinase [Bovine alphaherpesvirus 5]